MIIFLSFLLIFFFTFPDPLNTQLPPELLSSGESILLRFHSDDTIHNKGFSVAYQALEANDEEQVIKKEKIPPSTGKNFIHHQQQRSSSLLTSLPPSVSFSSGRSQRLQERSSQGRDPYAMSSSSPSASYRSQGFRRQTGRFSHPWTFG